MEKVMEQAIALKQRLEELKIEKNEIESKLYDLRKQVEPKAVYGNLKVIVDPNYQDFMSKEIYEAVRLVDYLLNENEKDAHMNIFGQINGDWKTQRGSVTYYRNEYGVLNHSGGGYVLLKDGIPCSDDEWEQIKEGNIPDKFSNFKNFR
jgi:hypothetical protein